MSKWFLALWTVMVITRGPIVVLSENPSTSTPIIHHGQQHPHPSQIVLTGNPPDCKEWNASNRLECWLWQLKIAIPNESFSADWITISIQDMVCSEFALQDLQPDYSLLHSLDLSVHQIVATCRGRYGASGGISGKVQASVGAESTTIPALQVALRLVPSTNYELPRPFNFETTSCQTRLKAMGIHFSGSASSKLIQAFSKTIGHYITQALQGQLCPLLPKKLDPLVTEYLHQLDKWMKPYLPSQYQHQDQMLVMRNTPTSRGRREAEELERIDRRRLGNNPSSTLKSWSGATFLSGNYSTTMNPLDWNSVRWTLTAFDQQLSDHLQLPWIIPANATQRYFPQQQQCQDLMRGISGLFRSIVGPALTIPLPSYFHNVTLRFLAPLEATISFGAEHISIKGLDRLNTLQILRPNQNQSLVSQATTDNSLEITAPISLRVRMPKAQHALEEPFVLKVNITKLETLLKTNIQISHWDNVTLLQVVNAVQRFAENPTPSNIRPTLGCLIGTIALVENHDWWTTILLESISISRFQHEQSFHHLKESVVSSLDEDLDHVINTVLELILGEYSELWTSLIHGLIQDPVKHSLNHFLSSWLEHHASLEPACPAISPSTQPKLVNFTKFIVLNHLNDFLNHRSTIHTMNMFLKCSGQLLEGYVDALRSSPSRKSLFHVTGVETRHWNAIQRVQLLQPMDDISLHSFIQWGSNTTVPELQINLRMTTVKISGSINVTLVAGFQGQVGTQLEYNLNRLENLTVAHLLQQVQCALLPTVGLEILPDVTGANLGPIVGLNISAVLNNQPIFYSTLDGGNHGDDKMSLAHEVASAMKWAIEWIREISNQALNDWVARSSDLCPGVVPENTTPDTPDQNKATMWYNYPMIWILLAVVVLAQGGIFNVLVRPREEAANELQLSTPDVIYDPSPLEDDIDEYAAMLRHTGRALLNDIRNESMENVDTLLTLEDEQLFTGENPVENETVKPLFLVAQVPALVRVAMPIAIFGTIMLLVSSNLSVGATVDLSLRVREESIPIPGLFQFSLGNTIAELYGAGIYPLLFLVVVFSGIWPYAKLIWMFYIWCALYCSDPKKREQRLLTLDALSKFSLVDPYVLVVMLVAFRFHLDFSEALGLDVFVTPEYGFYAFLLATCLSLVLGHGMLYFHRSVEQYGRPEASMGLETASILSYPIIVTENGSRRRLSWMVQVLTVVCCLATLVCLLKGMGQESFFLNVGGLAGIALGDRHMTKYSVLSLGWTIRESVQDPHSRAVVCLQLAYYFYAVVTPIGCLLLLLTLLVVPVPLQVQQNLVVAAEIAHAWSALEVLVLSIVAALFQLSTFASFIIGDHCDVLNGLIVRLVEQGIVPTSDASCFSVSAHVDYGIGASSSSSALYLIVGVLLQTLTTRWVFPLAHACVEERSSFGVGRFEEGEEEVERATPTQEEDGAEGVEPEEPLPEWRFWF